LLLGWRLYQPFALPALSLTGYPEVDITRGIRGKTIDLEVPATAEIVIEGESRPGETMEERPFGKYTGYVGGHREPRPIIRVKAVTHRNNPILTLDRQR